MSAAPLALLIVPILIRWAYMLGNKPSEVTNKFLPSRPVRVVYPAGLIMFGWGMAFETVNVLNSGGKPELGDVLGLILGAGFLAMTIFSWPVVIEVSEEELKWHYLLARRHVS